MYAVNDQGRRLFYETRGEGEPLLLLPGSSHSHLAYVESGLADALARDFTVCLMDFTGMGSSDRVTSMPVSQWAEDVVTVMEAAGYPRAHLGGTTLGGRVAARVAADHPDRVLTLLIDMPITGVSEEEEARISAMFENYAASPLAASWQRWHGELWHEAMDFFLALRSRSDFRDFYTPRSFLGAIEAPTLLCRSDEEVAAHPLAQAFEWHAHARESNLWIEPNAPHAALSMVMADEVARRYATFVAEHAPQPVT